MKMDQVASSQNDEFYTPEYAIKPILNTSKCPAQYGALLILWKATLSRCSNAMPSAACRWSTPTLQRGMTFSV